MAKKRAFKSRTKMAPKKSKRLFSKTASKTHKKNLVTGVMRGGIRL